MRRLSQLILILALSLGTANLAADSRSTRKVRFTPFDETAPRMRASLNAPGDSSLLATFDFDDTLGMADPQGWTSFDRTVPIDTFFSVDDFSGLGGSYGAITGSQSLWCGARPGPPLDDYLTLPGYGNNWTQLFESTSWSHTGNVTVSFNLRMDTEQGFDPCLLQYESDVGEWVTAAGFGGVVDTMASVVISDVNLGATFRLRFAFVSDISVSDEDGEYDSEGAVIIDDILVTDLSGTIDSQDFEGEAPGAKQTSDGDWTCRPQPAFGDFAGLANGSTVAQQGAIQNNTNFWTFFNGSPDFYGGSCFGPGGQQIVPFGPDNLDALQNEFIDNWIISPWIDLSVDVNGMPTIPIKHELRVTYDVYLDLSINDLVFYHFRVRSLVDGTPTPWTGPDLLHYGSGQDWYTRVADLTEYADLSGTHVQVAFRVADYAWLWRGIYGSGDCHSHAPLFDNIEVSVHEGSGLDIIYVDRDAGGGYDDGTSWINAFTDLQDALGAAGPGDEIWVAEGTYRPHISSVRTASFTIGDGVEVYGGFAGSEYARDERDWIAHPTILDGELQQDANATNNSYHVVSFLSPAIDRSTILDGFTIQNGYADGTSPESKGGGVYIGPNAGPTIRNTIVQNNYCSDRGGGIEIELGSALLEDVSVSGNSSNYVGGGVHILSPNAPDDTTSVEMSRVTVFQNGSQFAGGVGVESGVVSIVNSQIVDNTATIGAGGIYLIGQSADLLNVTMAQNGSGTGQDIFHDAGALAITNSILNSTTGGASIVRAGADSGLISYSLIRGSGGSGAWNPAYGTDGGNNIDNDPLFVNELGFDLHLTVASPALNAGNSGAPGLPAEDLDGNPRIAGAAVDMGAFEYPCPPLGPVVYVDQAATGANDGSSWADAFTDLQDALVENPCYATPEVWVAAGTYYPTTTTDRTISFEIAENLRVYGGFNGTEALRSQRDWRVNETVLSGDIGTPDDASDNSYRVVDMNFTGSYAELDGFTITDGMADAADPNDEGAGLQIFGPSFVRLAHLTVTDNVAADKAGGIAVHGTQTEIVNTLISDNAGLDGAGLYLNGGQQVLTNVTLANNAVFGFTLFSSLAFVTNSIIYDSINNLSGPLAIYSYSLVLGSGGSGAWNPAFGTDGGFNIDDNPEFIDLGAGDYHLSMTSPAASGGDVAVLSPDDDFDLDNEARVQGLGLDMGAYEIACSTHVVYVDSSATGADDGTSWSDAYTDLQDALQLYSCETEVWVARGTYYPSTSDPDVSFTLPTGIALYGGFTGGETQRDQRDWVQNPTILSGEINTSSETDNIYSVVSILPGPGGTILQIDPILDGFQVTRGYAVSGVPVPPGGGGLRMEADGVVRNIHFYDNMASSGAGLLAFGISDAIVHSCTFESNYASSGGAVHVWGGSLTLANSLLYDNQASYGAAIYVLSNSTQNFSNLTVVDNTASSVGGGIRVSFYPSYIRNSIFVNNQPEEVYTDSNWPEFSYSLVDGSGGSGAWNPSFGTDGGNNIDEDPVFAHPSIDDFHIWPVSPCIDAGDTTSVFVPTTDLSGGARVLGANIDMGAYEDQSPVTGIDDDDLPSTPARTALRSIYPNPFNPTVTIAYDLDRTRPVQIVIYDVKGRRVRTLVDEVKPAGYHRAMWQGRDDAGTAAASGVYFVRIQSESWVERAKILLLK